VWLGAFGISTGEKQILKFVYFILKGKLLKITSLRATIILFMEQAKRLVTAGGEQSSESNFNSRKHSKAGGRRGSQINFNILKSCSSPSGKYCRISCGNTPTPTIPVQTKRPSKLQKEE